MNPPEIVVKIQSWQDELDAMIAECEARAGVDAGFLLALHKCHEQIADFLKAALHKRASRQGQLDFSLDKAGADDDIDTKIRKVRDNVQKLKLSSGRKNRTVEMREG